ncbi:MAG TPA: hypothetical protein PLL80_01485 [Candidatus Pacearchaeota archaeon]|nr:hypothetical protein [Candidatus Pacearchaeota archaeon]HPO75264.1 hypothetical protein [Candidatus Pacearchaeota archaeon]
MDRKIFIPTILFIIILTFSIFVLSQENKNNETSEQNQAADQSLASNIILFYGKGCPHCVKVESYIKKNKIQDKIPFVQKEVYNNQTNAEELYKKAELCGLQTDSIGVPFLWDGQDNSCLMGEKDIINFFEQKIAEQE